MTCTLKVHAVTTALKEHMSYLAHQKTSQLQLSMKPEG